MDDSTGESGREFPVTPWSLILGLREGTEEERRGALQRLCERYWKPVFHYIRKAWPKSSEEAKDLTQAFFAQLLDGTALQRYRPDKGSFRAFLKVVLRGVVSDQHDALRALKRGGGVRILSLDGVPASVEELVADPDAETPEKILDRAWKKDVLDQAIERTRRWFGSVNRPLQFRVFEEYDLADPASRPTYTEVARLLGLKEGDVRNHLFTVRERIRLEIRSELAQTVRSLEELEEEWSDLFSA